jgi:hypothetical protein
MSALRRLASSVTANFSTLLSSVIVSSPAAAQLTGLACLDTKSVPSVAAIPAIHPQTRSHFVSNIKSANLSKAHLPTIKMKYAGPAHTVSIGLQFVFARTES